MHLMTVFKFERSLNDLFCDFAADILNFIVCANKKAILRLRDGSLQNQFLPGRFAPKPIFERDGSPRDGSLHL